MNIKKVTTKTPEQFHITEMEAKDAPVKNVEWHGQDLETKTRLDDPGQGDPVIIKCFTFAFPPTQPNKVPTKKMLLDHHKMHIQNFLWKDGLELREDIKPLKLLISKKSNTFKIFATCAFKRGFLVPRRIQDELKPLQQIVSSGH